MDGEHMTASEATAVLAEVLCGRPASRAGVFAEVDAERAYQDAIHGGPDHDDGQTHADWVVDIVRYARDMGRDFRVRMKKVAALAVAAIESHDRKAAQETGA